MSRTVLVAGATGRLGRALVAALAAEGHQVQPLSDGAPAMASPAGVEVVSLAFEDPDTFDTALAGIDGLFLAASPQDAQAAARLAPVLQMAQMAGVRHIVLVSAAGAGQDGRSPLGALERALMDSGVHYTILRPHWLADDSGGVLHAGRVRASSGNGKTGSTSIRNLAQAAAAAFLERRYDTEYNLNGAKHARASQPMGLL